MDAAISEPPVDASPLFERLEVFLDALGSQGLALDVEQRVRLHGLLAQLAMQDGLPQDPGRLSRLIVPILAGSPAEQDLCHATFNSVFDDRDPRPTDREDLREPEPEKRRRNWRLQFSLTRGLMAAVLALVLVAAAYVAIPYLLGHGGAHIGSETDSHHSGGVPTTAVDWINKYPIEELEPPKQSFWNRTWRWYYTEYTLPKWTALLLPFALWVAFLAWLYQRMLAYLRREALKHNLRALDWRPDEVDGRFGDRKLIGELQPMRTLPRAYRHVLDAEKTALASAEAAGRLSPRFVEIAVPSDFVALIDRRGPRDHLAEYNMAIVRTLRDAGLTVEVLEFAGDPGICRIAQTGEFLRLDLVIQRFSDSIILIFAAPEQLADPVRGRILSTVYALKGARRAFLITPQSDGAPTSFELDLGRRLRMGVMRTRPSEFGVLARMLVTMGRDGPRESEALGQHERDSAALVDFLAERPGRWMQRLEPRREDRHRLTALLAATFDRDTVGWLAATTVYPELRWPLTLSLNTGLFSPKAAGSGGRIALDSRVLHLVRLPWFRNGWMPDWTRRLLQQGLTANEEGKVRQIILRAIGLTGPHRRPGDDLQIGLALRNERQNDRVKADSILLDYLSPAIQPLQRLFAVPASWARLLGRRRLLRLGGAALMTLLAADCISFLALSELPIDECDLLAASGADEFRIGPGNDSRIFAVFYKDNALAACQRAVAREPNNGRFWYQLSRIPHLGQFAEGKKAADLKYPAGFHGLAYEYFYGMEVARDLKKAEEYYREATKLGITDSYQGLADVARARGDRPLEFRRLVEYQEHGGRHLYHLALFYRDAIPPIQKPDPDRYFELLESSAKRGDALAANLLGSEYYYRDRRRACQLFEEAVHWRGSAAPAYNLYLCYRFGGFGEKNFGKATYWAIFSAKLGHPDATSAVFDMIDSGEARFKKGYGPPSDYSPASDEFRIGESLEKSDRTMAINWYRKAAALGNQEAKNALKRLNVSESQ